MAEIKWIKIYTDMFDSRKIKKLRRLPGGNDNVLIWVMLLTRAGVCNAKGCIFLTQNIPYSAEDLAAEFEFTVEQIKMALTAMKNLEMIGIATEGYIYVLNWEEYQSVDKMEALRAKDRERKRLKREEQKLLTQKTTLPNNVRGTSMELPHIDIDKDIDKDIDNTTNNIVVVEEKIEEQQQTKKFIKPTIEEIKNYCSERKNNIDAEHFFNYYESKDWIVGKTKMKNWKSAGITWEKNNFNKGGDNNANNATDTRRNPNESKYSRANGWF